MSNHEEPLQIVLQSMELLVKLATMDTADYQASLTKNHQPEAPLSVCQLQKMLEDLQRQWPLEESFPATKLWTSIHSFHSTINTLQEDAEAQANLCHRLTARLQESRQRNVRLERAFFELADKNQKLVAKAKLRSNEKRSLVKYVQEVLQRVDESKKEQRHLTEQNEAYRLQTHELFLKSQQEGTPSRRRCFSHDNYILPRQSPPRRRCMSSGSDFSDLVDLDSINTSGATNLQYRSERLGEEEVVDETGFDWLSDNHSPTKSSLATAKGATVRLTASPSSTPPRSRAASSDSGFGKSFLSTAWNSSKSKEEPHILTITFPNALEIGLQFEKLPLNDQSHKAPRQPTSTSKQTQAKGLLNDIVSGQDELQAQYLSTDNFTVDHNLEAGMLQTQPNGFTWSQMFGQPSTTSVDPDPSMPIGSFVVCGFEGFDHQRNPRPCVGALLTSIDGEPVDGKWSLDELHEKLQQVRSFTSGGDRELSEKDKAVTSNEEKKDFEPMDDDVAGLTLCFHSRLKGNEHMAYKPTSENSTKDGVWQGSSCFNFLKKNPGPANSVGAGSLPTTQSKKEIGSKGDEKFNKIAKRPSFFPGFGSEATSDPPTLHRLLDPPKEDSAELLHLSSRKSASSPVLPVFQNPLEVKVAKAVDDAAEQCLGKETNNNNNNSTASATSNLIQLLSPQRFFNKSAPAGIDHKEFVESEPAITAESLDLEARTTAKKDITSCVDSEKNGATVGTAPQISSAANLMQFLSSPKFYNTSLISASTKKSECTDQLDMQVVTCKEEASGSNEKTTQPEGRGVVSNDVSSTALELEEIDSNQTDAAVPRPVAPSSRSSLIHSLAPESVCCNPTTSTMVLETSDDEGEVSLEQSEILAPAHGAQRGKKEDQGYAPSKASAGCENPDAGTAFTCSAKIDMVERTGTAAVNSEKFMQSMGKMFKRPFS